MSTPGDLGQQGEVGEGRAVGRRGLGRRRSPAEERRSRRGAPGRTAARRGTGGRPTAAASRSSSSKRRGIASVPSGSNSIAWFGRGRRKRRRSGSGGQDLGHRVGGGAAALRGRHLAAADVEELVGEVERRLAVEDLAGDRVRAVARAAGRGEVLAAGLDRHAEEAPLGGPLEVPGELGVRRRRARSGPTNPQPRAQVT